MGNQSRTNPLSLAYGLVRWAILLGLVAVRPSHAQASAPLLLPGGLAYDARGDLYFSDTASHLVRMLAPGGALTVVAGTGVQGFAGDSGPGTAARLDSPGALALDASGDLYISDVHNHRIRRVDASSGIISTIAGNGSPGSSPDGLLLAATLVDSPSALAVDGVGNLYFADVRRHLVRRADHASGLVTTVAGNGLQGFAGDGGLARAARLDSPEGLALDPSGNLFISDSHNQRVRRVDAVTGIISTIAGTGVAGFLEGRATQAAVRLPRGLTVDAVGNLYIVDAGNQRIRRVDNSTGQITTVAGGLVEGYLGDGAQAIQAALDMPSGVALSPDGLPTLADAANARIRQVDANGVIHTIVGAGAVTPAGLMLIGPATFVYGTGAATATLGGAAGTGAVTFLDGATPLGSVPLSGGAAVFSLAVLAAGPHTLTATYAGDASHGALGSNALSVMVSPAPVLASPTPVSQVYGLPVPVLTGDLSGVLTQDAGKVQASFGSAASALSGAGPYPISATLTGPAAGNYALKTASAAVTISKATAVTSLTSGLLAHVATTTAGQPSGSLTLLDGATLVTTLAASSSGDAQFSAAMLSSGSHTLSASYAGDGNFLPSTSSPEVVTIGPSAAADFALASSGSATVTVSAGANAVFSFTETPVSGALASPILLSVSGLPSGAIATFSPTYLPPGNAVTSFSLSVQTVKTAGLLVPGALLAVCCFGCMVLPRKRKVFLAGVLIFGVTGCGDRVSPAAEQSGSVSRTYNLIVNGTATSSTGAVLLHSVNVTLTVD